MAQNVQFRRIVVRTDLLQVFQSSLPLHPPSPPPPAYHPSSLKQLFKDPGDHESRDGAFGRVEDGVPRIVGNFYKIVIRVVGAFASNSASPNLDDDALNQLG